MVKILLIFNLLLTAQIHAQSVKPIKPLKPKSHHTPGSLCDRKDPHYTHDRYPEKVPYCERKVSSHLKNKIYKQYKVNLKYKRNYTIDHFIPLALGGDNSPDNLWPEHKKIKSLRPYLELKLYMQLRDGLISQRQAIRKIIKAKMNPPIHKLDRETQKQIEDSIDKRVEIERDPELKTQLQIEQFLGTYQD